MHPKLKKIVTAACICGSSFSLLGICSVYYEKEPFYVKLLIPMIQKLDPEISHKLAIYYFKYVYTPKTHYEDTPNLAVKLKHLTFKNPIGIAAGFDKNAEIVPALDRIGFGFVEIGSITPHPQPGNDKPRVFRLLEDKALINRYGFNNDGFNTVYKRLQKVKNKECVLGVNLGKNKTSKNAVADYVIGIKMFSDIADYFVINVSSPNTPGLRDLQKEENLRILLSNVIATRNSLLENPKPLIFLKLSPDLTSEERRSIASVLKDLKCRVDGLIISNTTVERDPSLKSEFASETGGLSGQPLKNRSTEMIAEMFKLTDGCIPLIGVGGIFNGEDALEKIKAGASLVQIYTSFIYQGPPVISKIKGQLESLLQKENFNNIVEAVGKSVEV